MASAIDAKIMLGIIGAGVMGRGIAQIAVEAGMSVLLLDIASENCVAAIAQCSAMIRRKSEKGLISAADADDAVARLDWRQIVGANYPIELRHCSIVIEAVAERLDIKRAVIAAVEALVSDDCVVATNTSALSVTGIANGARLPGRIAGFHFFNPVPLMKIVEVIGGALTEKATLERLDAVARRMGHMSVRAADTPGFIVNHAGRAYVTEALRIAGEGIASFADIDQIMVEGAGFRMGPFQLLDMTGLDVSQPVMESIYRQFYEEPRYRPSVIAARRLEAGLLGRKSGRGFYRYVDGVAQLEAKASAEDTVVDRPFWIAPGEGAGLLSQTLGETGLDVEEGETPSGRAIVLLSPLGVDCTSAAAEGGYDPTRCVAVDAAFGLGSRVSLMRNPASDPGLVGMTAAALARSGRAVTVIHDSPGFVRQRIIAAIVNVGCDIAQQRIATPDDIDNAVRLGLGYAQGPFAMGDSAGPARILSILTEMERFYGDPRYRATPWLKRRALLGLGLAHPD